MKHSNRRVFSATATHPIYIIVVIYFVSYLPNGVFLPQSTSPATSGAQLVIIAHLSYNWAYYLQLKCVHIQLCIFYHAVFVFVYVYYGLSPEIKLYYYILLYYYYYIINHFIIIFMCACINCHVL